MPIFGRPYFESNPRNFYLPVNTPTWPLTRFLFAPVAMKVTSLAEVFWVKCPDSVRCMQALLISFFH